MGARAALNTTLPVVVEKNQNGTRVEQLASLTPDQIAWIEKTGQTMDEAEKNWIAKGQPWTKDDEAFLERMTG